MNKYHVVCMVFISTMHYMFSQNCDLKLNGKVIDFHDGEPLSNATISFDDLSIMTELDGSYHISGLCPKTYTITLEHVDCNSQVFSLNPAEQGTRMFYLEHHSTDLTTVNLHAIGDHDSPKSIIESKLSKQQLEQNRMRSIGDVLTEVTGVSSLTTGSTVVKPVIQGLHSSRVLMINNGVRQQDQEWGVEHAPNIDLNAFENIKVIKGAGALQYGGDAIGGVIITESKFTSMADTIFGRVNLSGSTNGRGGMLGGMTTLGFKNGWSAKVQGGAKHFGDVESPNYILSNTGMQENSFSVGVRKHTFLNGIEGYYSLYNTTQGILASSHIGNITDLVTALQNTEPLIIRDFTYDIIPPKQETQHHLAKLKAYHRFKNFGKLSAQYAYQLNNREEFDIRRGSNRGRASVDLELQTHSIETSMLLDSNDDFTKNIGIQYEYQKNTPNPNTGVRRLIPDYEKTTLSAYAVGDLHLNEQWSLDTGLRYDYIQMDVQKFYEIPFWNDRNYDQEFSNLIQDTQSGQYLTNPVLDFQTIALSGGLHYEFGTAQEVSFNTSLVNRAPNPVELFSDGLHHSASIIELGDLRIQQEKALKFSLNYINNHLFEKVQLILNPHYSAIKDFMLLEPTGLQQTIRGAFPVWEYRQTNAVLFGIDLDVKYTLSDALNFRSGFSYIYGQDTTLNKPLILMPPVTINSELGYIKDRWNLALKHQLVLAQKRFPDNNFEVALSENGTIINTLVDISTPPQSYQLIKVIANYLQPLGRNSLNFGLQIQNLFNTTYRDYLNRQRYYADEIGRNIILNLEYKF